MKLVACRIYFILLKLHDGWDKQEEDGLSYFLLKIKYVYMHGNVYKSCIRWFFNNRGIKVIKNIALKP